jgi:hypothetical protein
MVPRGGTVLAIDAAVAQRPGNRTGDALRRVAISAQTTSAWKAWRADVDDGAAFF